MEVPEEFIDKYGGYWGGSHPNATHEDWKVSVVNGDTRLGYWEWAMDSTQG